MSELDRQAGSMVPEVPVPGVPATIHLTLDGRELTARAGQSVGAALTEAGIRSWRRTRHGGRPRGLFCGIGICYDCLITADGVPNLRACLLPASDGMQLTSTGSELTPTTDGGVA
jgi:predicted molibdopterin-dependent oxidoreductase YjgC|nr:(2Fe-2S)-binding protein [Conexibacter sp. S30A1]